MTAHTKYFTGNIKYCTSIKTLCNDEILVCTDKKEDITNIETDAVLQYIKHRKTCPSCLAIIKYNKEQEKRSSKFRVESKAKCGYIEYMEVTMGSFPNYTVPDSDRYNMERIVLYRIHNHSLFCIKCKRILKLNYLKDIEI
jgi:hypothetical protein